jgi:hypothetical protein
MSERACTWRALSRCSRAFTHGTRAPTLEHTLTGDAHPLTLHLLRFGTTHSVSPLAALSSHARIFARTHSRSHSLTFTPTNVVRARAHARTHTHTHTHTRTHALTHSRTHARTHARTHIHTHARTHAHTHIHTHIHTQTAPPLQSDHQSPGERRSEEI